MPAKTTPPKKTLTANTHLEKVKCEYCDKCRARTNISHHIRRKHPEHIPSLRSRGRTKKNDSLPIGTPVKRMSPIRNATAVSVETQTEERAPGKIKKRASQYISYLSGTKWIKVDGLAECKLFAQQNQTLFLSFLK